MTYSAELIAKIEEAAQIVLASFGITAKAHVTSEVVRGEERLKLTTDSFNTTPVIFKEVCVTGKVIFTPELGGNWTIAIPLNYSFTTFGGGGNGTELATITMSCDSRFNYIKNLSVERSYFFNNRIE